MKSYEVQWRRPVREILNARSREAMKTATRLEQWGAIRFRPLRATMDWYGCTFEWIVGHSYTAGQKRQSRKLRPNEARDWIRGHPRSFWQGHFLTPVGGPRVYPCHPAPHRMNLRKRLND